MTSAPVLLIVAKAPMAGFAKTRLAVDVGEHAAADLAAASLLDTLESARATGWPVVVALVGDLGRAARQKSVRAALRPCNVVPQRGATFGARLAAAHADAAHAHPAAPGVLQIGTDTPQVTTDDLTAAFRLLIDYGSVLGLTSDGGWWTLGLTDATAASCLVDVPMSRNDTCRSTAAALRRRGLSPGFARALDDVDCASDAEVVAHLHPQLRFSAAWRASRVLTP
jgi:glycosyltransferase A (GT-A) superfamily protein (DUF2064 family)